LDESESMRRFQPAWAARAHLLEEAGRLADAAVAYDRAISLTTDGGARRYLEKRRQAASDLSRGRSPREDVGRPGSDR
jgi:RNA polymerase sigma-70 factor (ECF subfamily)